MSETAGGPRTEDTPLTAAQLEVLNRITIVSETLQTLMGDVFAIADPRLASMAKSELQKGIILAIKAIVDPDSF